MANIDDRLAVRPAAVREHDSRKRFQSDRVESVRRQTLIPPSSACMANMDDRFTGQSQYDWQEGVVVGGSGDRGIGGWGDRGIGGS
jgi:hypothetical protein